LRLEVLACSAGLRVEMAFGGIGIGFGIGFGIAIGIAIAIAIAIAIEPPSVDRSVPA
jgi:hypothetical protein